MSVHQRRAAVWVLIVAASVMVAAGSETVRSEEEGSRDAAARADHGSLAAPIVEVGTIVLRSAGPSGVSPSGTRPLDRGEHLIAEEGFEASAFPPPGWHAYDMARPGEPTGYTWGRSDCEANTGNASSWAAGAGTMGRRLSCKSPYPRGAEIDSWLEYRVDTRSYAHGLRVSLAMLQDQGGDTDFMVCGSASSVGSELQCYRLTNPKPGRWDDTTFPHVPFPGAGGRDDARVVFKFYDPGATGDNFGVLIDDVKIWGRSEPEPSPTPTEPGQDQGWIAFESNRSGRFDAYAMRPDGTDVTRLAGFPGGRVQIAWSPDARSIAYSVPGDNWDVYTLDLESQVERRITSHLRYDGEPVWSPDGEDIAFHSDRDGYGQLYAVPAAGGEAWNITRRPIWVYNPAYSPDGQSLAFVWAQADASPLYTVDLDRPAAEAWCVTCQAGLLDAVNPSWSHDGEWIAFSGRFTIDDENDIFIIRPDGSDLANLTRRSSVADYEPAWSPGGEWIAFNSDLDDDHDIYVMRRDGSEIRKISLGPGDDVNPSWSMRDPPALGGQPTATPTATVMPSPTTTPPSPLRPVWPATDLVQGVRDLLIQYYNQEPVLGGSLSQAAPFDPATLPGAPKDPDMIWELLGATTNPQRRGDDTRCHGAEGSGQFIDCTGARLAKSLDRPYEGGLTLFRADDRHDFYYNLSTIETAASYVVYHGFVHDFDDCRAGSYTPSRGREPRDYCLYHRRVIAGYEAHMRDIIGRMFRDTRADNPTNRAFQHGLTRSAGVVASRYALVVQVVESLDAWPSAAARREALSVLNGLNQRLWWEWVVAQRDGPTTAGFLDFGSRLNYEEIVSRSPEQEGKHQFWFQGRIVESLRPARFDVASGDGVYFDADYAMPGEPFCDQWFADPDDKAKCVAHARHGGRDGDHSPFGEWYGDDGCTSRIPWRTDSRCGQVNLGSMAEEWLWSYVGARAGMAIINAVAESGDVDLPIGAVGPREHELVTERLGYGVSGWHGGEGRQDEMEWQFSDEWPFDRIPQSRHSIRTLSAAMHDAEAQNGRHSNGELAISAESDAVDGDTWLENRQEHPGAIENHFPGPSTNYGAFLLGFVLTDKSVAGLSPSLYDNRHRNHPDEFATWAWLLHSTFYRCSGVEDPADGSCLTVESQSRRPLFLDPDDESAPLASRYLFRDSNGLIDPGYVASDASLPVDRRCRTGRGLPWADVPDGLADWRPSGYLVDEYGWAAYNCLLQGMAAFMRLAAARYDLPAPSAELRDEYEAQRQDVLRPWYEEARRIVTSVIRLYRDAGSGYGYVPEIENSSCVAGNVPYTWRSVTAQGDAATAIRRARWYSAAALWYWYYASEWQVPGADW